MGGKDMQTPLCPDAGGGVKTRLRAGGGEPIVK